MTVLLKWQGERSGRASAKKFLEQAADWFAASCASTLVDEPALIEDENRALALHVRLHTAAPPLVLRAPRGRGVEAAAQTSPAGPGYHRYVADALRSFAANAGVIWSHGGDAGRDAVEREMLQWVARAARTCLERLDLGVAQLALSMPPGPVFLHDGALTTPMGPRDRAWLERAAARPELAIDVFPWWADGTGPEQALGRALNLLWVEVPFRPPLYDGERDILETVASLLREAHAARPDLAYPWREWAEVLALLGERGALPKLVRARAARAPAAPPIGYRRGEVRMPFGGWSIDLPASVVLAIDPDDDEGETLCAREHGVLVRFTPYDTVRGAPIELLLSLGRDKAPIDHHLTSEDEVDAARGRGATLAHEPVNDVEEHQDVDDDAFSSVDRDEDLYFGDMDEDMNDATVDDMDDVMGDASMRHALIVDDAPRDGWARFARLASGETRLEGHVAVVGSLAVCTVFLDDDGPAQRELALRIWRSIMPLV